MIWAARPRARVPVADEVAAEIKKASGFAASNGDSVDPQGAERIIKTGIDSFGRIQGVNNAAMLHDRLFHNMNAVD